MDGTITFTSLTDLAEFLAAFSGSTARFETVRENGNWVLTFTGAC